MARLGVVVPARNEAERLGSCLAALDRAAQVAGKPLEVVVVLDACVDDSRAAIDAAPRSAASRFHVTSLDAGCVGTARRVGMELLLELLEPDGDWVSTTDADSQVPLGWFRRQLAHRAAGASLVAGSVHVPHWQQRASLRPHWERAYAADGHRHVHGANLSFLASAYRRAGGFADVTSDEDVLLVRAFAEVGEPITWAGDLSVATSARRIGRAPHGFASYLNQLAGALQLDGPEMEAAG